MATKYSRTEVVARIVSTISSGRPIIAAGAGNGLSAKCAELGGVDLIIIYNSGRFRMDGMPSIAGNLPYGNANDIVLEMGERHVLPAVKTTPVLAGVCGTDPTREMRRFLRQVAEVGFSGVINYPTVARFDGAFRRDLESVGLGFARETEMIANALELDLYTTAYVRTPDESRQMAGVGVDVVIPHVGLTTGGTIGAKDALSLQEAAAATQAMIAAARAINPKVIALAHGGPIAEPKDVAYILEHTEAQGFVGASSMERLPVERAIINIMKEFKSLKLRTGS
jgi:predicted TIM-barrel enzyme